MVDRQSLSKGEMEVARVLWELCSATVRQVHGALPTHRQMDFTTVQTYLRRLAKKGYVRAKMEGRTLVYSPRIKSNTVIRQALDDIVERLFGGETLPLMRHLIEDRGLKSQQLAELRQLIDRLEEESNGMAHG